MSTVEFQGHDARNIVTPADLAQRVSIAVRPPRRRAPRRSVVLAIQALIVLVVLAAWQWLPQIHAVSSHVGLLNREFIGSPEDIAGEIGSLVGGGDAAAFWPAIGNTLRATVVGCAIGTAIGMLVGLVLSQSDFAAKVLKPFIAAFNSIPLIAFIPIIVVIFGISIESSTLAAVLLSVFVVFFNALEGGRSVRSEIVANCKLLGGGRLALIFRVRFPYVLAWTFTALPAAISFALVGAVATEFLVGVPGIGKFLTLALSYDSPKLTFALAILLGAFGAALVGLVSLVRSRLLHWWDA